ncbi:MAG: mechanosensitive ion channel family protein [Armatimonadota bacterium]|nr:mechanosensitive ion channel family protein [Armatimonadota bacterium]
MTLLERSVYGNPVGTWLLAVAVGAGLLAVLWALRRYGLAALGRRAAATPSDLDDLLVALLARTRGFFLLALGVHAAATVLTLPPRVGRALGVAVGLLVLLQIGLWGSAVIGFYIGRAVRRTVEQDAAVATTLSAFGFLARLVLWTLVAFVALDNLGVNITALVAGLGVGGIAVALALQNVLGDLFASFSIVLDKPFVIGDFIVIDGFAGTVERIGLKTTRVRSLSGEEIVFSNADLLKSRVRNYKRMQERRVVFSFGVVYETPPETLARIPAMVRAIVEAQPLARFDRAHFAAYGEFALTFEVAYYVRTPDYAAYMDTQQAINLELYRRFQAEGIEFAYPTRVVYVRVAPEAALSRRHMPVVQDPAPGEAPDSETATPR